MYVLYINLDAVCILARGSVIFEPERWLCMLGSFNKWFVLHVCAVHCSWSNTHVGIHGSLDVGISLAYASFTQTHMAYYTRCTIPKALQWSMIRETCTNILTFVA